MAVTPGNLPLEIIRGIEFYTVILQCRDDDLTVTGTLSPDVTGTYKRSGVWNDQPLFILEGSPSTFCYYHPIALSYLIARTLTRAGPTDYWVLTPQSTEPTGSYAPAGAYTGTATATDHPVDLTDYTPQAQVRTRIGGDLVLDLNPSVTDAVNGEITIPAIPDQTTEALTKKGTFAWDLVLLNTNTNERLGPFVVGQFVIRDNVTQGTF